MCIEFLDVCDEYVNIGWFVIFYSTCCFPIIVNNLIFSAIWIRGIFVS